MVGVAGNSGQAEVSAHLFSLETSQVTLVRQHQKRDSFEVLVWQQTEQLHLALLLVFLSSVAAVDHVDEPVGVLEVGGPDGAETLLAADVPGLDADILHADLLDVAPDGGLGVDALSEVADYRERPYS